MIELLLKKILNLDTNTEHQSADYAIILEKIEQIIANQAESKSNSHVVEKLALLNDNILNLIKEVTKPAKRTQYDTFKAVMEEAESYFESEYESWVGINSNYANHCLNCARVCGNAIQPPNDFYVEPGPEEEIPLKRINNNGEILYVLPGCLDEMFSRNHLDKIFENCTWETFEWRNDGDKKSEYNLHQIQKTFIWVPRQYAFCVPMKQFNLNGVPGNRNLYPYVALSRFYYGKMFIYRTRHPILKWKREQRNDGELFEDYMVEITPIKESTLLEHFFSVPTNRFSGWRNEKYTQILRDYGHQDSSWVNPVVPKELLIEEINNFNLCRLVKRDYL